MSQPDRAPVLPPLPLHQASAQCGPAGSEWIVGWDIGGAHVKACLVERSRAQAVVRDACEWACPLWLGLDPLQRSLALARKRWPQADGAAHALTMTGEMVDLFEHREDGVLQLGAALAAGLEGRLRFYAGTQGWCDLAELPLHWASVASANWHASADLVARSIDAGVLVDIGSTTTDLIAVRGARVRMQGQSDAVRLASGELVYHGVVRTPLCALAPRIAHGGRVFNVMNEFFATTADVYRLTAELDPAHDLQPSADGAAKDALATRRRLARMIGLDARDASDADWLAFAHAWRALQLAEIGGQLQRVIAAAGLPADAPIVGAGCGDFLAAALAAQLGRPHRRFAALVLGRDVSTGEGAGDTLERWMQVAAPSVAVALLLARGMRSA